jgi:hypothetical protein
LSITILESTLEKSNSKPEIAGVSEFCYLNSLLMSHEMIFKSASWVFLRKENGVFPKILRYTVKKEIEN